MSDNAGLEKTAFPADALKKTKQDYPSPEDASGSIHILTHALAAGLASASDSVQPWGPNPLLRDKQLRSFLPTESYLAGAIFSVCNRNAAFEWVVESKSDAIENSLTDMLNGALGSDNFGWINFMLALSQDYYGTDNGAFIELIRDPGKDAGSKFKKENAPVVGIAHIDSNMCARTGNPKKPVIFTDIHGKERILNWWDIVPISDFPSSVKEMNGVGLCAVSRVLRMAQILRSIEIFKDEKIGGRHYKAIHLVSGPSKTEIVDVMERGQEESDNQGMLRFQVPAILASLDPQTPVSHVQIDIASLPDGFDIDAEMRWYISALALGLGVDYQDLAPLPTGNIGSANQSEILHRKSRGKGPAIFMQTIQSVFRDYGVVPRNAEFKFKVKDLAEDLETQELRKANAETLAILVNSGVIAREEARTVLVKEGVVSQEMLQPKTEEELIAGITGGGKRDRLERGGQTIAEDASRTQKSKGKQVLEIIRGK